MTGLTANAREAIVGETSPRGALSRFLLVLSVLIFAIASVIPDTWAPLAMTPEGDAIAELVLTDASVDGDPVTSGLFAAVKLTPERSFDSFDSDDSRRNIAPNAFIHAYSFEARGPPAV